MNERLKELAEQAGVSFHHALGATYTYGKLSEILERFADLVDAAAVAREREACAKLCDESAESSSDHEAGVALNIQEAIRARGNHESS